MAGVACQKTHRARCPVRLGSSRSGGSALIRSRNGTDLTLAFPELAAAVEALPSGEGEVLFDGEIVLWIEGRLAFEKLLTRINRKPPSAARLARELAASYVAFDLLHHRGASLVDQPYARRREAQTPLFARLQLAPPWTLCPASTDPEEIGEWLAQDACGVFRHLVRMVRVRPDLAPTDAPPASAGREPAAR